MVIRGGDPASVVTRHGQDMDTLWHCSCQRCIILISNIYLVLFSIPLTWDDRLRESLDLRALQL